MIEALPPQVQISAKAGPIPIHQRLQLQRATEILLPVGVRQAALIRANDTPFGLAAYFYTKDLSRIFRVSEALEAGMIGINDTGVSSAVAPFGGVKESGIGREGSILGLEEYLDVKTLHLGNLG